MKREHDDLFARLAMPFGSTEIKVRTQSGHQLHYITARTCMNRLDDVLGPANWWDEYVPNEKSVLCRLTIRLPDGTTLTKADAGGYAGMADSGDDDKSGYSDSFKRACVKFGIARYLYRDGVPAFVQAYISARSSEVPPEPEPTPPPRPRANGAPPSNGNGHHHPNGNGRSQAPAANGRHAPAAATAPRTSPAEPAPKTGGNLFRWLKQAEEAKGVKLVNYINQWAKLQEFPVRMVGWDTWQVDMAHAEAVRKLAAIEAQSQDNFDDDTLAN